MSATELWSNRTQVYERKDQLEAALEKIELASPGRPENGGNSDIAGYEWQGSGCSVYQHRRNPVL